MPSIWSRPPLGVRRRASSSPPSTTRHGLSKGADVVGEDNAQRKYAEDQHHRGEI